MTAITSAHIANRLVQSGSQRGVYSLGGSVIFVRGKKTKSKGSLSPMVQRAVTQLSVMSASRKQPKMLKLCKEDLIKHQLIQKSWSLYNSELRDKREDDLQKQYTSIKNAMTQLKELDQDLYSIANEDESNRKFPMELKVPTDYPPNKPWQYTFRKAEN